MDITICDKTALNYWRIPPVVQLLAAAPEADIRLDAVLTPYDFERLSANYFAAQSGLLPKHCGRAGEAYRGLMDVVPLLALCGDGPFDVLCSHRGELRESSLVRPRLWSAALPTSAIRSVADGLFVTSPEFTLQQVAAHESFEHTLIIASWFCGSFSVFHTPDPMAGIIQRLCNAGKLPSIGGWSPCLDSNGSLTDLWSHDPLTTPADLRHLAETADSPRGRAQLARVAKSVVAGAASPFEVQAGILLGLPARFGGAGLGGFEHNKGISLTPDAALIAQRGGCYCDLYWDEGLDLECHSKTWHSARDAQLSDFARETALELMGIDVVALTFDQLRSKRQFDAIVRIVADKLGRKTRAKSASARAAEAKLREEVLGFDWQ